MQAVSSRVARSDSHQKMESSRADHCWCKILRKVRVCWSNPSHPHVLRIRREQVKNNQWQNRRRVSTHSFTVKPYLGDNRPLLSHLVVASRKVVSHLHPQVASTTRQAVRNCARHLSQNWGSCKNKRSNHASTVTKTVWLLKRLKASSLNFWRIILCPYRI
jgi:hypothetical protein